ncbi:MAG: chromosomal replication initiator protein DnaA [Deltaproteobacteria bacterium]|nr:chromosomal replication initiator protein DnaA [Deltaproteobacteria bacterium]
MENVWAEIKNAIKKSVPGHTYMMWIEPLTFTKNEDNKSVAINCPNYFSKKRIQENYIEVIESEVNKALGEKCKIAIKISGENGRPSKRSNGEDYQLPLPNLNIRTQSGRFLKKDFTFDNFVVGTNNDFAYSASISLAAKKSSHQNSLFLLSNTGMGKSHLSQAIGHHVLTKSPSDRVYYITAEDFSNEMVHAFRHNNINKFKEKYRNNCDVLLLEDVHHLSGKERTQVELSLLLDFLFDSEKRIIFSSCYLPVDIPKLNEKLYSRLSCGLISNIEPPNFRTRVRILRKKSNGKGCQLPEKVVLYLASELSENVRQLESGLLGVMAKSSLLGVPIDLNLATSVVKNIARQHKKITIDVIKKLICKHFSISVADIISSSRKQSIVRPRQLAMYLSRKYTDSPLQDIGRSFNRYHATALHSINSVEKELKENNAMIKQVEFFKKKLESGKY